jgi:class 3 adenylate cyclase
LMAKSDILTQAITHIPEELRYALFKGEILPEHAEGAALFADISGYTPMSEALSRAYGPRQGAEELINLINLIFNALVDEVNRYRGTVIGFVGDAISCWFDDRVFDMVQHPNGSLRAVACAFAMQSAIERFDRIALPGENPISIGIKITIASGPICRFQVGDPAIQRMLVLAGKTLQRMEEGEHLVRRGEVLADYHTVERLGAGVVLAEQRSSDRGNLFTVLARLNQDVSPCPWPDIHPEDLNKDQVRPWLLPQVYERLKEGQGEFLTELRPVAVSFVRFSSIDYDHDEQAENKLNDLICRVQNELILSEGTLLQVVIGDKGSYMCLVFGAPTAHEDDARRAVKAALAMRETIQTLEWHEAVQIGISTGMMRTGTYGGRTRRTYAVLGDDVNLAARLMSSAAPGEVLISSRVYKAISVDSRQHLSSFLFEPRPPVYLKGKSDPLPVFAIVGAHQERAIRLQEPGYALPMIGRQKELALIGEKIDQALSGRGQVVGITAEAGIGKSRLMAEAIRAARRRGLIGYGGACQSDGINTSYLVWGSIWRAIFEINPESPSHRQLRNLDNMLEEMAPERRVALPLLGPLLGMAISDNDFTATLEPRFRRSVMEELLLACLQVAAQEAVANTTGEKNGGLCLVLEDLHWIDQASSDLLKLIIDTIKSLPVLILLAFRPTESKKLEKQLAASPCYTEIALHELSEAEAEQAIRAKLVQLFPE